METTQYTDGIQICPTNDKCPVVNENPHCMNQQTWGCPLWDIANGPMGTYGIMINYVTLDDAIIVLYTIVLRNSLQLRIAESLLAL